MKSSYFGKALMAALLSATTFVSAQVKFPDGPIRLIVPFAAGGGVDNAARLLAKQMQTNLNIPFVVENKPGASGTIGGKFVQTAAPDGHTLLFSASTQALTKLVIANAPYDPASDFSYVARIGEAPLLMVISPTLPQTKLKEVIAAAKQNPDKWAAGLPALGAASHLGTLMFATEGHLNLTMTTYRGTAPALTDVAGGHTQILIDSIISLQSLAKAGKVKPIIVTSSKRSSVMPNVPTAVESGYRKFVTESWYGIWAPKNTPDDRIQFLNKAANEAVRQLAKSGAFEQLGIEPVIESTDEFKRYANKYISENAELLKSSGFKPD
ncbi:MAG: tripartite tricarboxylate transporter substrate binding protein [Rhodoferax sp.]|nr:tripartite tricarboxylate transporter substrate binding protein [Rhodoferax sp.]